MIHIPLVQNFNWCMQRCAHGLITKGGIVQQTAEDVTPEATGLSVEIRGS